MVSKQVSAAERQPTPLVNCYSVLGIPTESWRSGKQKQTWGRCVKERMVPVTITIKSGGRSKAGKGRIAESKGKHSGSTRTHSKEVAPGNKWGSKA